MIWCRSPRNCQTHFCRCQKSALLLLKENNGRIIRPKSALVFSREPVGAWFFCGTRQWASVKGIAWAHFPGRSLIGRHKKLALFIMTYMLWGLDHWLRPGHTHSVHTSSETKHGSEFRVPDMCFSLAFNCQSEPGSHLQSLGVCAQRETWDKFEK